MIAVFLSFQDDGIEIEVPDNEFQEEEETEEEGRSDRRTVILHRIYDRKQETGSETTVNNKSNRKEEEKRTVKEDVKIKQVENDNETAERKQQIVNSEDYKEKSNLKDDKDEKYRRERRKRRRKREKSNHRYEAVLFVRFCVMKNNGPFSYSKKTAY